MFAVPALKNLSSISGRSLATTISGLAGELAELKRQLHAAGLEIARLTYELTQARRTRSVATVDEIGTLRRRVAYYCHPDRGGDGELMSQLNRLFDALEHQERRAA